jgi:hypothetical protein
LCGGRRQLQRPSPTFLAAHVGEIERAPPRLPVADDVLGWLELAAKIGHCIGKMAHTDRLDPRQGSFRARFVRTDDSLELGTTRAFTDGEHTADATQAPIECKLSARRMLSETCTRKLVRRREQRQGDGQIESRALLLKHRRGQIDGDATAGELELGERSLPDSLLLPDGTVSGPEMWGRSCHLECAPPPRLVAARGLRARSPRAHTLRATRHADGLCRPARDQHIFNTHRHAVSAPVHVAAQTFAG